MCALLSTGDYYSWREDRGFQFFSLYCSMQLVGIYYPSTGIMHPHNCISHLYSLLSLPLTPAQWFSSELISAQNRGNGIRLCTNITFAVLCWYYALLCSGCLLADIGRWEQRETRHLISNESCTWKHEFADLWILTYGIKVFFKISLDWK